MAEEATALDPRLKDLKCLPKDERGDIWREACTSARLQKQHRNRKTKKKTSVFIPGSSDVDTEEEGEPTEQCLGGYKAELKEDMSTTVVVVNGNRSTGQAGSHPTLQAQRHRPKKENCFVS